MRKFIAIALLGALCTTMFAGCATSGVLSGNKGKTNVESSSSNVSTETTSGASSNTEQVTTEMPTTSPVLAEPTIGSSKYKTLNDWYVDNKSGLDKIAYNLSNGTLTCEISCEGNILTYTYTFVQKFDSGTTSKMSKTLFDTLSSKEYKDKFDNAARQMSGYVEGTCFIVVCYKSADGETLAKKTYFG